MVFLRLLKDAVLDDSTFVPTTPKLLSNSRFEKLITTKRKGSSDNARIIQETFKVTRNLVIYYFLQHVLDSLDDRPFVPTVIRKAAEPSKISPEIRRALKASLGDTAKVVLRRRNEEKKSRVISCENCGQTEHDEIRLSACASCRDKLGRRVFYCSKECQKKDWKLRHKLICGKPMTLDSAQQTAVGEAPIAAPKLDPCCEDPLYVACILELWEQRHIASLPAEGTGLFPSTVGPAISGYKRSLELQYQISLLNDGINDARDYLLSTTDGRFIVVCMPNLLFKSHFRKYRDAALYTGDRDAVAIIAQFLSTRTLSQANASNSGYTFTPEGVLGQLTKEYGFDVAKAVADLERQRMARLENFGELERIVTMFALEGQKMLQDPALAGKRKLLMKKAREDLEAASKNKA